MISSKPAAIRKHENPEDESNEHEWAEYNLPLGFLVGRGIEEDDKLAFIRFGIEQEGDFPEGSG